MSQLPDALNALFGGLPDDAALILHDKNDQPVTVLSSADLESALKREPEPYVAPIAGGLVAFVHDHVEAATADEWLDLRVTPTVVLTKGRSEVRYYALCPAQPRGQVEGIAAAMGCDLDLPVPLPGANGWTVAHIGEAAFTLPDLAAIFMDTPSAPSPDTGVARHKDAVIRTPFDFGDPRLSEVVTITGGGSAMAPIWRPRQMTRGEVIDLFCSHRETAQKDGPAVVLGEMPKGPRSAQAVASLSFVGLDIDTGFSEAELVGRIESADLMAVVASTYSHMKTITREPHDALIKWMDREGLGDEITLEIVKARLESKGVDPAIVATATFEAERGAQGREIVVHHAPMPKWRVIVPLAEPFVIADNGRTDAEGREAWRRVPEGLAALLGGLPIDKTGGDANRLFYLPAHAAGASWRIDLFGGNLLDWRKLLDASQTAPAAPLKRKLDQGQITPKWAARYADGFMVADLIRDHADDRVRADKGTKLEIECPFDSEHSNAGAADDRACMVVNADDSTSSSFVIKCQHDSCNKRDRLDMLNRMVADDWFPASVVLDSAYDALDRTQPVQSDDPYPLPPEAGSFNVTTAHGRTFYASKGGDLAFTRFSIVGGARYPDRADARDVEIAHENERGERETFRIDATKIPSRQTVLGLMRGQGIAFGSAEGESAAHRLLMVAQPTNQVVRDRTGWLEDGTFMLPTGVAVGDATGSLKLADSVRIKAPATRGTLDGWTAGAAAACGSASLSLKAGILAGLAGPLVALTGQGTLVILFTGTSSQGKTWRQQVGVSASGPVAPGIGQLQSMNSTQIALEIPLERGSGTITAFDELHHAPAKVVQNLIYTASGQQGRNRANNTGAQGIVRSWRGGVVTLSSEVGLAQRLRQEGERLAGGATVRMIEVDASEGRLDAATFHEADAMLRNFGHALPVMIEALRARGYVTHPALLAKLVNDAVEELGVKADDAMAFRSATGLAYLIVAGEIAQQEGLLPASFDVKATAKAIWAGAGEGDMRAVDPVDRAISELFESINVRWGTDVYDPAAQDEKLHPRDPSREIGAIVSDHQGEPVYVLRASLLGKWSGGFADERALKAALLARGIAVPYDRPGKSAGAVWDKWRKPIGRTPCLVLRASFVEGESEPSV